MTDKGIPIDEFLNSMRIIPDGFKLHINRLYREYYECEHCGKKFDWPWQLGGHIAGKMDLQHGKTRLRWGTCTKCEHYEVALRNQDDQFNDTQYRLLEVINKVPGAKMPKPAICPFLRSYCLRGRKEHLTLATIYEWHEKAWDKYDWR